MASTCLTSLRGNSPCILIVPQREGFGNSLCPKTTSAPTKCRFGSCSGGAMARKTQASPASPERWPGVPLQAMRAWAARPSLAGGRAGFPAHMDFPAAAKSTLTVSPRRRHLAALYIAAGCVRGEAWASVARGLPYTAYTPAREAWCPQRSGTVRRYWHGVHADAGSMGLAYKMGRHGFRECTREGRDAPLPFPMDNHPAGALATKA